MRGVLVISCLCFIVTSAMANTTVIAKVGSTLPVSAFVGNVLHPRVKQKMLSAHTLMTPDYAVVTKSLSPGFVKSKNISEPQLSQPIFIVGDDNLSKKWLKKYSSQLNKLHALGIIVNTSGSRQTSEISKKYHVVLLPIKGTELSNRFHLKHYPVLISAHKIEQ